MDDQLLLHLYHRLFDDGNPRSVAFQIRRLSEHMAELPRLAREGEVDPIERSVRILLTEIQTSEACDVDDKMILGIENRLLALSTAITGRYFDQGVAQAEVAEGLG